MSRTHSITLRPQETSVTENRNGPLEIKRMKEIRDSKQKEKEKEEKLSAVLKDTLKGLEKLELFLDAVEKLTVTSSHVFSGQIFLQSVTEDARIDAPVLIHFKRDAETFFQPLLHNRWKTDRLPSVQLSLRVNGNTVNQMLDHLNQLCEIRMDQHTRLAFLFQEDAQKFIDVFSERRSRMWQFLSDLEETASKLDSMKKRASISTVAGSSVGIVGAGFCIAAVFAPFTAGASLACAVAGAGLGFTNSVTSLATGILETAVNSHQEHNVHKSLKRYTEDMDKIQEFKDKAASFKGPLMGHCTNSNMTENVITIAKGVIDVTKDVVDLMEVRAAYKAFKNARRPVVFSGVEAQKDTSTYTKAASVVTNGLSIGLDIYFICKESASLANGSETEISQFIRSRVALWKTEMKSWEEICESLQKGVGKITESLKILDKPFLP